ncbi:hypothetical protein [Nocardia brasiliensis]|uniref:hypothetical protein n=1 Tax=Nocardia brasiliensis TaxID=37326 RepID=UPI00366FF8B2
MRNRTLSLALLAAPITAASLLILTPATAHANAETVECDTSLTPNGSLVTGTGCTLNGNASPGLLTNFKVKGLGLELDCVMGALQNGSMAGSGCRQL